MRSDKLAFRIIKGESEKRFSANAVEIAEEIEYEIKFQYEETIYQQEK